MTEKKPDAVITGLAPHRRHIGERVTWPLGRRAMPTSTTSQDLLDPIDDTVTRLQAGDR